MHIVAIPSSIPSNPADKEQFKGPIRTVVVKSPRVRSSAFSILGKTFAVQKEIRFDRQSRAIRIIDWGSGKSDRISKSINYDDSGCRTVVMTSQASIRAITSSHYDKIRRLSEVTEKVTARGLCVERRYEHQFNERNDLILTRYKDDTGLRTEAFYNYDYDKMGNIIRVETTDNGRLSCESAFEYGADSFTEERLTYRNGSLQQRTRYSFDSHENVIEITTAGPLNTRLGRTTHTFLYDDIGNWIERRTEIWDSNGKRLNQWMNYQKVNYW